MATNEQIILSYALVLSSFIITVLLVWIKVSIHALLTRRTKRKVAIHLLKDEVQTLYKAISTLRKIKDSANGNKVMLVSMHVPNLISKNIADLSEVDSKNAYYYSNLLSSIEVVKLGLDRLFVLILKRAKVKANKELDLAISAQAKITASDSVSYGNEALKVIKIIGKNNNELIDKLEKEIEDLKSEIRR
uniref:Uncharacterized protein n=1 Tax=Candidatus Kentrum sp. UNK TaxID=2126344 RepID=A0A451A9E8_9GAMM|nr:MAG: hypothetical protein BECKUNK1418G_GA0071005_10266 [Candidatus Kentron sp. UNK]VFK70561.1 MAG: hypothetical protein BECKUNK1418H_GA0071006_10326 [Candidatus Kentron sp. UNK]